MTLSKITVLRIGCYSLGSRQFHTRQIYNQIEFMSFRCRDVIRLEFSINGNQIKRDHCMSAQIMRSTRWPIIYGQSTTEAAKIMRTIEKSAQVAEPSCFILGNPHIGAFYFVFFNPFVSFYVLLQLDLFCCHI